MSKLNSWQQNLIVKLLNDIKHEDCVDSIKTEIIKEELKNNQYQISSRNIARKMLELSKIVDKETAIFSGLRDRIPEEA